MLNQFPSAITYKDVLTFKTSDPENVNEQLMTLASGEQALQLALKQLKLGKNDSVAIPAYCCEAVRRAVLAAGLVPVFLDLKTHNTYLTDYSAVSLNKDNVKAVVLVHLYGQIHPDVDTIQKYCGENKLFLIHDAAQSYGLDENRLSNDPIIYSFGPGKSSTAALGGIIKNIERQFYDANVQQLRNHWLANYCIDHRAKHFLGSRSRSHHVSGESKVITKLISLLTAKKSFYSMSHFQIQALKCVQHKLASIHQARKIRFEKTVSSLQNNSRFSLINPQVAIDSIADGYKLLLYCRDVDDLLIFLRKNDIIHFRLYNELSTLDNSAGGRQHCTNFANHAPHIVEISTDANITDHVFESWIKALISF